MSTSLTSSPDGAAPHDRSNPVSAVDADVAKEIKRLAMDQQELIIQHMTEVYSSGVPFLEGRAGFEARQNFKDSMTSQYETIEKAKKRGDLDALRVYAQYPPSHPSKSRNGYALECVVMSIRSAGYSEVFPVMAHLNVAEAAMLHNLISDAYKSGVTQWVPGDGISDEIRKACALGPKEVAGFMVANPITVAELAAERKMDDYKALIGLVESMMEAEVAALTSGLL
jgi:hypothetical protein